MLSNVRAVKRKILEASLDVRKRSITQGLGRFPYTGRLSRETTERAKEQIQLQAYASFHINLFEIVYVFFHNNQNLLTTEEREVYVAWTNWLGEVLRTSEVFCEVLEKGIAERSYNQWFVDYVTVERAEFKAYLARGSTEV